MSDAAFFTALALAVDERIQDLPPGCDPARLFGVVVRDDGAVRLLPLWSGVARELPAWVAPPASVSAIALETGGWAAPLEPDGSVRTRPSLHPERRRIHHTCLVHGDGDDISVMRYGDEAPEILTGAAGVVLDKLVACWQRRAAECAAYPSAP